MKKSVTKRKKKTYGSPKNKGTKILAELKAVSEDLCKNYYSHLYFTVVTFLTKIQNWCYITKKTCQNTTIKKVGW